MYHFHTSDQIEEFTGLHILYHTAQISDKGNIDEIHQLTRQGHQNFPYQIFP